MIERCVAVMLGALVGLAGAPADAQPADAQPADAQPARCYEEPSEEQKNLARTLHERAHKYHERGRYGEAAELYVKSLEHWPSPRVHLRAGILFMNAARMLEAFDHLREALRCDGGELEASKRANAQKRLDRLRARLAELEVDCREPEARVLLNGAPWFTCGRQTPDRQTTDRQKRVVFAGPYVVEVQKPGYFTVRQSVTIKAGERVRVTPNVLSIQEGTLVTRRWAVWKPWSLLGAGVALGAASSGLLVQSIGRRDDVEQRLATACPLDSCSRETATELERDYSRSTIENRVAMIGLGVSATIAIVGMARLYANRPRSRKRPEAGTATVKVTPMAAPEHVGVTVGLRF